MNPFFLRERDPESFGVCCISGFRFSILCVDWCFDICCLMLSSFFFFFCLFFLVVFFFLFLTVCFSFSTSPLCSVVKSIFEKNAGKSEVLALSNWEKIETCYSLIHFSLILFVLYRQFHFKRSNFLQSCSPIWLKF